MNKLANRLASRCTLLSALLLAGAAVDPGGLFAPVAWTGGAPRATLDWWAPYLIFAPLALALYYCGVWLVMATAHSGASRSRLVGQIWLIAVPACGLAWSANAVLTLYAGQAARQLVLGQGATLAFLLWSGGYATAKIGCLAWIPALAVLPGLRLPNRTSASSEDLPLATTAGLTTLLLAMLSFWIARHWWFGSPVGYIYRESPRLIALDPADGLLRSLLVLAVCGLAVWFYLHKNFRQIATYFDRAAALLAALLAGTAAALILWVVQVLGLLFGGIHTGSDYWMIPACAMLLVEACSFALVLGACCWIALLLAKFLQSPRAPAWLKSASRASVAFAVIIVVLYSALPAPTVELSPAALVDPIALRVQHRPDHAVLTKQDGTQIVLRGVNVNQLGEYYQADPDLAATQPLTREDFVEMAALGLNSVRLTLSWSRLEPQRGQFSADYLAKIRQAVEWATDNHIYVVLDMHQDAWGMSVAAPQHQTCRPASEPMTGWDGAPAWATLSDDAPPCQFTGRDLAPNVSRAFQSFYLDRDGIQTELIHGWAILASSFADNPQVIGYDLLNEPNFAENPPISSTLLLTNFYARTIAAIRSAEHDKKNGYAHPVIIEPSIFWSGFGFDNLPPAQFLHDDQLIFSPHLYNESISSDQDLGINLVSIERGFRLAQHAADSLHAALWIGEWGFFGDSIKQQSLWQRQAAVEDQMEIGSALWVWKQGCGDPHVYPGKVAGNVVLADCPQNLPRGIDPVVRKILQRPYPR